MSHDSTQAPTRNFWGGREATWHLLRPPLRPAPQDIDYLRETIQEWRQEHGTPRLLLLGVTPEVHELARAENADLLAADLSREMIRVVWPGPKSRVIGADWSQLPLRAGTRDIASCDGGYVLLGQRLQVDFVRSLRRVLSPGGRLLLRVFTPRDPPEKPKAILDDLREGKIHSVHELKLRLMVCGHGQHEGVTGRDIWRWVHEAVPDLPNLAEKLKWEKDSLPTLNSMRHSGIRYFRQTYEEVLERFAVHPGGFRLLRMETPDYELGSQCPTYVFRRE